MQQKTQTVPRILWSILLYNNNIGVEVQGIVPFKCCRYMQHLQPYSITTQNAHWCVAQHTQVRWQTHAGALGNTRCCVGNLTQERLKVETFGRG